MKFVQNFLTIPVSMLGNTVVIAPGKSAEITDKEAEHPDVMYSVRKRWIQITDTQMPDIAQEAIPAPVAVDDSLIPVDGFEEVPSPEIVKKAADKARGKTAKPVVEDKE